MERLKRFFAGVVLAALGFLGGYVPKEIETRRLTQDLRTETLELRLADLHRQLGVASHEAQRNNFASAATAARGFFEGVRAVSKEHDFSAEPRTQIALSAYGSQGDVILGQLANADPAAKGTLASLYLTMNGVLERRKAAE